MRNVIFWGKSPNIQGNVAKHSGKCRQTFRGVSSNIPGNVVKHSGECPQKLRGISPNIPSNVNKHFEECRQTFWGMFSNIPGNVAKHLGNVLKYLGKCYQIFREMLSNIPESVLRDSSEWESRVSSRFQEIWSTEYCMGFVAVGRETVKQLKLDQATRNFTFGDLEILLLVIGLAVTGLKKTGVVYILGFFGGKGRGVVVWFRVCGATWTNDWAIECWFYWFLFHVWFSVLVKGNGIEFKDKTMLPCFRERWR